MTKSYNKIFKSKSTLLPEIEDYVLDIAKQTNISELKLNNLEMAVAEASANCILHGNKSDESKKVEVTIIIESNKLIVKFKDEGSGFKIDEIPDPTKPENILKNSGRGVHIMKSFLDNLEYNFTSSGTEAILTVNI
ncbi:MAG: ATP-binding protein [Ignavibacteriae bacterium]|nr:ATP-binding protein [Ignavibacteriota bacterium]